MLILPQSRNGGHSKGGISELVPTDTRDPEYDEGKDEEIIEDDKGRQKSRDKSHAVQKLLTSITLPEKKLDAQKQHVDRKPAAPRKSEILQHEQSSGVLDRLLSTKVDLAIGEVLGISMELSGMLGDKIKPKLTKMPPITPAISNPIAISFHESRSSNSTSHGKLRSTDHCNYRNGFTVKYK